MIEVVAAILESEGRVLIGRRQPAQAHPLKWEFPGGKVEPGESPPQALTRELEEELGIREAAGEEIATATIAGAVVEPLARLSRGADWDGFFEGSASGRDCRDCAAARILAMRSGRIWRMSSEVGDIFFGT